MSIFQDIAQKLESFKQKIPQAPSGIIEGGNNIFQTISNKLSGSKPALQATLTPEGEQVVKKQTTLAVKEGIKPEELSFAQKAKLSNKFISQEVLKKQGIQPTSNVSKETFDTEFPSYAMDVGGLVGSIESVGGKVIKDALPNVIDEIPFNPQAYMQENIARREAERVKETPSIKQKISSLYNDFKRKLIESNAPVEDVLNETLQKNRISILPSQDISNNIDRVLRSEAIAGQFIKDKGLSEVIQQVKQLDGNVDDFGEYLIAKHAKDVDTRGFATGRNLTNDQKLVDALGSKYEPFAEKITQYSKSLLQEAVDSGLISQKDANYLQEIYPNYVPINRVFSELEKADNIFNKSGGIANVSKQNVVMKLQGSERAIENPIESLVTKTASTINQVEKNKAFKVMSDYEKLPGNPFGLKEIESVSDAGKSKGTITGYIDGQKKVFEVNKT
jgi:hypothetical protein